MTTTEQQEWLCLRGYGVIIDGVLGPATRDALQAYQRSHTEPLDEPLTRASSNDGLTARKLSEGVRAVARRHLREHPREVGGQNCGPWVRHYMCGVDGPEFPWCAGFVSTILGQAATLTGLEPPIPYSWSCTRLAESGDLVHGPQVGTPAAVFLIRKGVNAWQHTGLVTGFYKDHYTTIEGNTNDDGHREGYEVCERRRSYRNTDFIVL